MQCGCHAPVGAFAKMAGNDIMIYAFISDLEGANFIRREIRGAASKAMELAEEVAGEILDAGGREILRKIEK
jgi:hydroxymethylbilane synthase